MLQSEYTHIYFHGNYVNNYIEKDSNYAGDVKLYPV